MRALSGLGHWMVQRASAVLLAFGTLYLLLHFSLHPPADHAAWRAWVSEPARRAALVLLALALAAHAWVGVRDILLDYIKPVGIRLAALFVVAILVATSTVRLLIALVEI